MNIIISNRFSNQLKSLNIDVIKELNGEYEADFIDCRLWTGIAESTAEYCKKGDLLGVRGRVETRCYEKDEKKNYLTEVIAEKVTFLSNKKSE